MKLITKFKCNKCSILLNKITHTFKTSTGYRKTQWLNNKVWYPSKGCPKCNKVKRKVGKKELLGSSKVVKFHTNRTCKICTNILSLDRWYYCSSCKPNLGVCHGI